MLSTSWKNHIRSIKAHIVHMECEAKKITNFKSFVNGREKKTLVKKRINVEKSIFIYVQEKLVPFGTKEVKRTAAMFVMKKKT